MGIFPNKLLNITINSQSDIRIPLYRFADVMLLRAEALNQVNRKLEAIKIVNDIRARLGFVETVESKIGTTPSTYNLESVILAERKLEFFGEGKRWFDLIRNKQGIDGYGSGSEETTSSGRSSIGRSLVRSTKFYGRSPLKFSKPILP